MIQETVGLKYQTATITTCLGSVPMPRRNGSSTPEYKTWLIIKWPSWRWLIIPGMSQMKDGHADWSVRDQAWNEDKVEIKTNSPYFENCCLVPQSIAKQRWRSHGLISLNIINVDISAYLKQISTNHLKKIGPWVLSSFGNLPDFMKSGGFHGEDLYSCIGLVVDHEIRRISWNLADFMARTYIAVLV